MTVELHLLVHRVGTAHVSTRASQQKFQMRWEWGCEVPPLSEELLTVDSWLLEETSHCSSGIQAPRGYPHSSSWSHNHAHNLMEIVQGASRLRHLGFTLRTTEGETGKGTGRTLLFPIF